MPPESMERKQTGTFSGESTQRRRPLFLLLPTYPRALRKGKQKEMQPYQFSWRKRRPLHK
jgi:hypothetical protein